MYVKSLQLNAVDQYGCTPIHVACQFGNLEAVTLLLGKGAKFELKDENGDTPLHEACRNGNESIVKELLEKMSKKHLCSGNLVFRNDSGLTPLHKACREGHTEVIKLLVKYSSNSRELVAAGDNDNATALHYACQKGNIEIITTLLEEEASIVAARCNGITPLHIAAQVGRVDVMKQFLGKGGLREVRNIINVRDNYGQTPLHYATEYGHTDMIKFLLEKYAFQLSEFVTYHFTLYYREAKIDAKDIHFYTPLLTAAEVGQPVAFKILLESGAKIKVKTKDRKSVLYLAAESNHKEIIEV